MNILVVDEDIAIQFLLKNYLEILEYSVIGETQNKNEIFAMAKNLMPDIIFIDLPINNDDYFKIIKNINNSLNISIILTSVYPEASFKPKLNDINYCGFLEKPFSLEKISTFFKDCMERHS